MRIAHINVTANLSTGRIAAGLCRYAQNAGHKVLLCYGRGPAPTGIPSLRIGDTLRGPMDLAAQPLKKLLSSTTAAVMGTASKLGVYLHGGLSRLTDRSGFYSSQTTRYFLTQLDKFQPELVHLHNLHGYYLNVPMVIDYLRERDIPVVWTLHDSWPYTGHCAYYHFPIPPCLSAADRPDASVPTACLRWQKGCSSCPLKKTYPTSWLLDQSSRNYMDKWTLFTSLRRLALATPSRWLAEEVKRSFFSQYPVHHLPNGLDLSQFRPCGDERLMQRTAIRYGLDQLGDRRLVLSVAAVWDERKGLSHLTALSQQLGSGYCVAVVGLTEKQQKALPAGMLAIPHTATVEELCALYTIADLYISLSQGETMGMTLLESMACGTQVLCYHTTAMPELVTPECGESVPVGDIAAAADAVRRLCDEPKDPFACMEQAARYSPENCYRGYLELYEQL